MYIGRNKKIETVFYNGAVMKNSKEDKIIGFIFDNQLKSKYRVGNICKKCHRIFLHYRVYHAT